MFPGSFWSSPITFRQSSILVGDDFHARLTDFEFSSIIHGMNSATQGTGYSAVLAVPEILEGADTITREADVFAFSMVTVEVGPRALPHLALEAEGRMALLIFECYFRFLQEGVHSVNSQPRPLFQRL